MRLSTGFAYPLDSKPSAPILCALGLQHVCIVAIGLVFPVLLVRHINGTPEQAAFMVSMSLLAGGVGTVLQALPRGPLGSGYLCPQVCGPSFLSASMLAARTGGLSLVLGMIMSAGVLEALFSRILQRLRFLFPSEVTGLIVAMVGITVVRLAALNFFGLDGGEDADLNLRGLCVALLALSCMVGLNIWSKGKLRLFCSLLGMIVGYVAAIAFGEIGPSEWEELASAAWFAIPLSQHPGWSFDASLILPFAIAMLCSSLKTVGDITTCQKINDTDWRRPDMNNASKGLLADAAGCSFAGLLGGFGQSTSSSNVGLSIATGATSRYIAFAMGGIMFLLGFCPKLSTVFAIMPAQVVGATLIFALSFMAVAGFQIIMSRMLDNRKTFVVGISLIVGLMVDVAPAPFRHLPEFVQPVFSSSLSTAAVLAVLLNLLFRIGISSTATMTLQRGERASERIPEFFDAQGKAWGARPEVIRRAARAGVELAESVLPPLMRGEEIVIRATFDEYKLVVKLEYQGEELAIPTPRGDPAALHRMLDDETCAIADAACMLAFMEVQKAGQAGAGGQQTLRLVFEH